MDHAAPGELTEFLTEFTQRWDRLSKKSGIQRNAYTFTNYLNCWPEQRVAAITGMTEGWINLI